MNFNFFDIGNTPPAMLMLLLYKMGNDLIHPYAEHPKIVELLNSDEKFDICIIESFNVDALVVRSVFIIQGASKKSTTIVSNPTLRGGFQKKLALDPSVAILLKKLQKFPNEILESKK